MIKLSSPFSGVLFSKNSLIIIALGAFVLAQALGVIYTKQARRSLHSSIQALYATRDKMQVEWSKLLLEQGTWQAESRVERIAREQLHMTNPDKVTVITP